MRRIADLGYTHVKIEIGAAEVNPFAFHPFSELADGETVDAGYARVPQAPGIGFELHANAHEVFRAVSVPGR
ncbi:hypothetical protein BSFP_028770 [Burkholderia stabilis]|uniref:Enolase C-terminal domain-containing protein n=1 Tax=Burkholderia stabilis TaxID=95485 RepID=A0A1Y1BJH4_9BURK|nr:hypothetical protein BSFP_028770 [Burkholderia stabilis]